MADFVPQITAQTPMNTAFISLGFLQVVIALIHKICDVRVQPRNRKPLTRLVLLGAWDSATSENSLLQVLMQSSISSWLFTATCQGTWRSSDTKESLL